MKPNPQESNPMNNDLANRILEPFSEHPNDVSPLLFSRFVHQDNEPENSFNEQQQRRIMDILQLRKKKNMFRKSKPVKTKKTKDVTFDNPNLKKGHWTTIENKRYHWFLQVHCLHFVEKQLRRQDKIFKNMAVFIGSRQPQQCRSHHQKMQKKHKTFYNILLTLRKTHYGSSDAVNLEKDLKENSIRCREPLVEADMLENGLQLSQKGPVSNQEIEDSADPDNLVKLEEEREDQNYLLAESYQQNLDLHFN